MNEAESSRHSPSATNILTHIVFPVTFVYFVSHRVSRKYAVYLLIAIFGSFYGYSSVLKPAFHILTYILSWIFLIPFWAAYILRWIYWRIIWGIKALAWFGFYVHFGGYAMKFILESIDKILIWVNEVIDEMRDQDKKR
ncbi:hypothetical protein BDP27DRAFT_1430239 [Rhodocollybia butyracea]|uniref:Uncharacterized protein n=1 Tax=Rhodocollybia butyracea TaxID=206335 RepID=A0A9P5PBI9_9AGAR|nr:hypothetical protein BDP27DRAFT_1430239 [Rhodocollybia butyracea]